MLKTMMSSLDSVDEAWKELCFSGHLLLPPTVLPSRKWLRVFERWSFASIVAFEDKENEKYGKVKEEGYWESAFTSLVKKLVICDLNGGALKDIHDSASYFLDRPYDLKNVNLKAVQSDIFRFPTKLLHPSSLYPLSIAASDELRDPRFKFDSMRRGIDVSAQVTLISRGKTFKPEWLYINMSSYDFWDDDVVEVIKEKYNTLNLGGWLFKIREHDTINQKFQSIIEAA